MNAITRFLSSIASSFQPAYDKIRALELNKEQSELLDQVWGSLGPAIQKALWGLITIIITKYGPDAGKKVLEKMLETIKKEGWIIE